MKIRVVLADDQALLRATFRLLLDAVPDIDVVAEAANGEDTLTEVHAHRPDVVLMDIRMPGVDGIEATRRITAADDLRDVRILMLTTFETEDLIAAALHAGASGYLGKGIEPSELIDAIRTIAAGESLLSPAATTALIARFRTQPDPGSGSPASELDHLTDRERQLTALAAAGLSNTEIARRLVISPATVKTHINRAMVKTGARDRAQLVIFAYETRLVRPGATGLTE